MTTATKWAGQDKYGFTTIDTETRSRVSIEAACLYEIMALQVAIQQENWIGIEKSYREAVTYHREKEYRLFINATPWPFESIEYFEYKWAKHKLMIHKAFHDYMNLMLNRAVNSLGTRSMDTVKAFEQSRFKGTEAFRKAFKFAMAEESIEGNSEHVKLLNDFTFDGVE